MNLSEQIHRAAQRATDDELTSALQTLKEHVRYREELQEYVRQGGRLNRPMWASLGKKMGRHWS